MAKRMTNEETTHVYAAFLDCGCMCGVCTDYKDKSTRDFIVEMTEAGMSIKKWTWDEYRSSGKAPFGCQRGKHVRKSA